MQTNTENIVKDFDAKFKSFALESAFRTIARAREFRKQFKGPRRLLGKYQSSSQILDHMAREVDEMRRFVNILQECDPLKEKKGLMDSEDLVETYRFSYDSLGQPEEVDRFDNTNYLRKDVRCYLLPVRGEFRKVNTFAYWPDELMKALKTNDSELKLHNKLHYFRIGDEFYSRREYFPYNNQPYKKSEYALNDFGQLVDLKRSIKIESSNRMSYNYRQPGYARTTYFELNKEEEFFNTADKQGMDYLSVRFQSSDLMSGLLNNKFIMSMLKSGNKRLYHDNDKYMYLSKELAADLDLVPSEEHKQKYQEIMGAFRIMYNRYHPNETLQPSVLERMFNNALLFKVEFVNSKNKGILPQIIKELFSSRWYTPLELKERLVVFRKLLAEEKKYAKQ